MLWGGAILCFVVFGISPEDFQTLALAIVLILVVFLTSLFQMYQEGKSDDVMASLNALVPTSTTVIRNGNIEVVPVWSLVPGDVVKVVGGEKVPADVRVLACADLKVNNASLTGENLDVKLSIEPRHTKLYEAKNIARFGCNFTAGAGTCVVFATGDHTFFGDISRATTQTERPETLMKREISRLIHIMAGVAFVLGVTFFILALFNGYSVIEAIVFCIGIIVANVPEGLLPQMTVALTLTAQRMKRVGLVVRNLEIIETLGACSVICSDKTGTLTLNRMTVSHLYYGGQLYVGDLQTNLSTDDFKVFDSHDEDFLTLSPVATLNNDAIFMNEARDSSLPVVMRETKGDASDTALIKFFEPLRSVSGFRKEWPRRAYIPFNSGNKWMLSVNQNVDDDTADTIVLVKGAPERVRPMCSHVLINGQIVEMTEERIANIEKANKLLALRGERVLGFAQYVLPLADYPRDFAFDVESEVPNFPTKSLVFIGLISLMDPARPSVLPAVQICNKAGVRVFMITGDHPDTAHTIAKNVGIITGPTAPELLAEGKDPKEAKAIVVHGSEMSSFTEERWLEVLSHDEIVFARTMPQQKQDIVIHLNKMGDVVAMTGDGVNDAPALKAANVGIAMGTGTQVAKDAASIILSEDDFGSIVMAISEGRLIFDNLKKCIAYVLSSNVPEIVPFIVFIVARIPLGLETVMILLVDLGTDLAPAVSLAYEEPEDAIMERPPRDDTEHLVGAKLMVIAYGTIGLIETIAGFWAFFYVFSSYGFPLGDLVGAGPNYRTSYNHLDNERKEFFHKLCLSNTLWQSINGGVNACMDHKAWTAFRVTVLSEAQSAFLLATVWAQIGNVIARKSVYESIWTRGLKSNMVLVYSVIFEIALIVFLIWCPTLNGFLLLAPLRVRI